MEPVTPAEHTDTTTHSEFPAPDPKPTIGSSQNSQDTPPALVLNDPYKPKNGFVDKLTNGMTWYGLELALSVVGLLMTTIVITYALYALVNYLKGIDNPYAVQFLGEFSLIIAASMIVWLPLAVVFYLRTRAELVRHPATNERLVHKLFVGFFLFSVVLTIAGVMFSVIYSLIRMAVGIDDQPGDTAIRVVLPGVLAAAVNIGLFWAYGRHEGLSRKLFAIIFGGVATVLTIALLAVSVTNVQGSSRDAQAASDLNAIQSQISTYYTNKQALPSSLSDLDTLSSDVKGRIERYSYKKDSSVKYQLCAMFRTDTSSKGYPASAMYGDNGYTNYASFGTHGTGEKCFKLMTSYASYYNNYYNSSDSGNSPLNNSSDSSSY